jgi:hypothetical protein
MYIKKTNYLEFVIVTCRALCEVQKKIVKYYLSQFEASKYLNKAMSIVFSDTIWQIEN